ncbi:MAG TPA: MFS transporter, partial [Anaerolineae bacterium]|nr:MFS transporter [Anaerolineae bacterium]
TPARLRAQAGAFRIASIFRNRSAIAFLLVWLLVFLSFENVQVGYASWFETQFGLSAQQRGMTQTLFGVFEIAASAGSSLFLDRIGKKRGVTGGLIILLMGYGMLVIFGPLALWLGLAAMSVAFLGFEFSVVSGLSIASEQVPQARGTMLALGVMMAGLGKMVGAVTGTALIAGAGFGAAALLSALLGAAAAGLFALFVRERPATAP